MKSLILAAEPGAQAGDRGGSVLYTRLSGMDEPGSVLRAVAPCLLDAVAVRLGGERRERLAKVPIGGVKNGR